MSLFIERPIATLLFMISIALCGTLAWLGLPVAELPEVALPTIQVLTAYPGANPQTTSTTVSAPLERRLGQMTGLQQMDSTSAYGLSVITLQFALEVSLDVAEQEVQQAIDAAAKLLPAGLPAPPTYSKINPADAPILTLALSSDTLALPEVEDIADTRLVQKLSQVPGVGQVTLTGGQRKAIVIEARGDKLAAMGRSLASLRTAVGAASQQLPKGSIDAGRQAYTLDGNDQLANASDYQRLNLDLGAARPVPMATVAHVAVGPETARQAAWSNSRQVIELEIRRQPDANVIDVADRVQALLPGLRSLLPATVRLEVLSDRTASIRASVRDVERELVMAIVLVVAVTFLFLRDGRATMVPALSVPVTLLGTLGVMYALGFSLNNLTLMALTVATGFVVDDAIVVLENIVRRMDAGETPKVAAAAGSRQIGFTIVSLSLALVAVMIPLLFMPGMVGRLFREFAVTLSAAVLVSALVSLVMTPMLCAHVLSAAAHGKPRHDGPLERARRAYGRWLAVLLDSPAWTLLAVAVAIAASAALLVLLPKGLFPTQDTGVLSGVTLASPTVSFEEMSRRQQALVQRLLRDPAVEQVTSSIGVDAWTPSLNQGQLLIRLKPAAQRDTAELVAARLLRAEAQHPELQLMLHARQDLVLDTQGGQTDFRLGLQSTDRELLSRARARLARSLQGDPVFRNGYSATGQIGQQLDIVFDRDAQARLGLTQQQLSDALYDAFGERQISTIFTALNQYHVVLSAPRDARRDPLKVLDDVFVATPGGRSVPLSTLASLRVVPAPLTVARQDQFPYVDLSFDLAPGQSLGAALRAVQHAQAGPAWPASVDLRPEGSARVFEASLDGGIELVVAALLVVYILMGVLYESVVHPLTILSTLPAASVGALCALALAGMQFDVIALIGIVLLVGIVMKNAIMMIDFALELQRRAGQPAREAILNAAQQRFRPILMTTMASLVGALPLAFGAGIGAELRRPMGVAIIGGLIASQVLTLCSTPVVYLVLNRASSRFGQMLRGQASIGGSGHAAGE
ncbi:efflux RND transporter permease subunit [Burkholderia gladioli]|uniref:efflux RND transporter permease subunit n=1 Tax=Burkholderia gladioli TaxID=28095 RepID=UPI001641D947|nr:efflux RND transporter permease subunit [Burkholderia gladioli]